MPNDDDDERELQAMITGLQTQLTQCLHTNNPREQLVKTLEKTVSLQDLFNLHFRDEEGYTLLGNAVRWHLMDVVKFLVEEKKFKVKEELVLAVEVDYKECVEYLIKVKPVLLGRRILAGTTCRPGMTPVMMASLKENESMLKLLFANGARPLEIPEYNPRETNNIIRFDAIYRTLLALSKPMYLCVMNEDPVMVAFKIAETCKKMAESLDVAKDDLLEIKRNCEKFAADFIQNAATFEDLELILSQMTTEEVEVVAPGRALERLKYAMIHDHMNFVANGSVQKLIKKKFYEGPVTISNFQSANLLKRSLYISALIALTPVWLFLYLIFPASNTPTGIFVKEWMEMPLMRFIVNAVIYVIVCLLVISTGMNTNIFPLDKWPVLADDRLCFQEVRKLQNFDCVNDNPAYTREQKEAFQNPQLFSDHIRGSAFVMYHETFTNTTSILLADMATMVWTFGNVYQEFWNIWSDGVFEYCSDWVNMLSILLNLCFVSASSLKYSFIVNKGYEPMQIFGGEIYHPLQLSAALRALGVLLLCYKMYKLLRVTQIIGRQQVLLIEALKASVSLFVFFFILAFSFSVASNGVIWRTYRDYIQNCNQLPNNSYATTVDVRIPCSTNLVPSSLQELINYQNFIQVSQTYFFGMFRAQAYILDIFPSYENGQEWTGLFMYSGFVFFMIIVRLNLITFLVVFSVMTCTDTEAEHFKFGRANIMYMFIQGSDPLPSPFNLIPSVYRITAWKNSRNEIRSKMFTENELWKVPKLRSLIKSYKLTYLREVKKSALLKTPGTGEIDKLNVKIREQLSHADNTVLSVDRRTRQLFTDKKGVSVAVENPFTKKYQQMKGRSKKLFKPEAGAIGTQTPGSSGKKTCFLIEKISKITNQK